MLGPSQLDSSTIDLYIRIFRRRSLPDDRAAMRSIYTFPLPSSPQSAADPTSFLSREPPKSLHSPPPPRTTILERLSQGLKRVFRKLHTKLQAAVHAFRGVPQGRAAGAWDAHAALMDRSRDRYG